MRRFPRHVWVIVLTLSLALGSRAQPQQRVKVEFECTCNDTVGKLYATAFRDLLANSPRYIEAPEAEEHGSNGKVTLMNWSVKVVSIDPSSDDNGSATALSVAYVIGDTYYLRNSIQTVGRTHVADAAQYTLATLDKEIQSAKGK